MTTAMTMTNSASSDAVSHIDMYQRFADAREFLQVTVNALENTTESKEDILLFAPGFIDKFRKHSENIQEAIRTFGAELLFDMSSSGVSAFKRVMRHYSMMTSVAEACYGTVDAGKIAEEIESTCKSITDSAEQEVSKALFAESDNEQSRKADAGAPISSYWGVNASPIYDTDILWLFLQSRADRREEWSERATALVQSDGFKNILKMFAAIRVEGDSTVKMVISGRVRYGEIVMTQERRGTEVRVLDDFGKYATVLVPFTEVPAEEHVERVLAVVMDVAATASGGWEE